jgi:hypothetical protein
MARTPSRVAKQVDTTSFHSSSGAILSPPVILNAN